LLILTSMRASGDEQWITTPTNNNSFLP